MRDRRARRHFVMTFVLGVLVSAEVGIERVFVGSTEPLMVFALLTLAATAALASRLCETRPERLSALALTHALGLGAGLTLTHVALFAMGDASLVEAPRQWVNDGALGLAMVLLAWSFLPLARLARVALGLAAFGVMALYHLTAARWHLDHHRVGALSVQGYVFAQFVSTAVGLIALQALGVSWLAPMHRPR